MNKNLRMIWNEARLKFFLVLIFVYYIPIITFTFLYKCYMSLQETISFCWKFSQHLWASQTLRSCLCHQNIFSSLPIRSTFFDRYYIQQWFFRSIMIIFLLFLVPHFWIFWNLSTKTLGKGGIMRVIDWSYPVINIIKLQQFAHRYIACKNIWEVSVTGSYLY